LEFTRSRKRAEPAVASRCEGFGSTLDLADGGA